MTHPKIDFKKHYKHLYAPSADDFSVVEVPPLQYLMVDGVGAPYAEAYTQAIAALYPMAYALKFFSKATLGRDYTVPPLEALWWAEDWSVFVRRDKDAWSWTTMILQPDWLNRDHVEEARRAVRDRKDPEALDLVRLETLEEGLCVQLLHIGSYEDETEPLRQLHEAYLPQNGLTEAGKHHEVYLSDPRRVAPERLKTVLRQPVRRS